MYRCIGVLGILLDIDWLKLFFLFFLFGFLDVVLSMIQSIKEDQPVIKDLKLFCQGIGMLVGIPIIYLKHGFRLPSISNYSCKGLYQLPFHGQWLTVNGGLDQAHSHSWNIPNQRYAYDFYVEQNHRSYLNDGKHPEDYICYDMEILAPEDGIVVELKDEFEDTIIKNREEAFCDASDIRGNYIIIDHGHKEYSMIAHIKKGSFRVNLHDNVKKGEVVAHCGNSGNTSEPHIHFQLQKGKSCSFCAGLPVTFTGVKFSDGSIGSLIQRGDLVENNIQ